VLRILHRCEVERFSGEELPVASRPGSLFPRPSFRKLLIIMLRSRGKLIWFFSGGVAVAVAASCILVRRPAVALNVISVQRVPGSPTARCEISNRGDKPIELAIHSIDRTPFYDSLERPFLSWRGVWYFGVRKAFAWRPTIGSIECGIDAKARSLGPGETLPFTATIFNSSQPVRLAVRYRLDGADFTASSKTINP